MADIHIFNRNEAFHSNALHKRDDEFGIEDTGILQVEHPDSWAVIVDKGYQRAAENFCAVTPIKKPPRGELSPNDLSDNQIIASDRIIVGRFLER